jgi:hypothetical protein
VGTLKVKRSLFHGPLQFAHLKDSQNCTLPREEIYFSHFFHHICRLKEQ